MDKSVEDCQSFQRIDLPMDNNNSEGKSDSKRNVNNDTQAKIKPKFINRPSMLSQLTEDHLSYQTIGNVLLALICLAVISSIIEYHSKSERLKEDIEFMESALNGLLTTGLGVFSFLHLCYIAQWFLLKILDSPHLTNPLILGIPFAFFMTVPLFVQFQPKLGPMVGLVIPLEHMRFFMKIWSLVTENYAKSSEEKASFGEAIYFLFASTLFFQKSYPRSKERRWVKVVFYAIQFLLALYVMMIVSKEHLLPSIKMLTHWKSLNPDQLSWLVYKAVIYGSIVHLASWFSIFHAWFNLSAELLRFGDRRFYADWWNADSPAYFMPRFNYIVSLFLKEYIYKPVMRRYNDRSIGFTITLIISCFCIDLLSSTSFKFFLSIWLVSTGPQIIGNDCRINAVGLKMPLIIFPFGYLFGISLLVLHGVEYWSRQFCQPLNVSPWIDPFLPYFIYRNPSHQLNQTYS